MNCEFIDTNFFIYLFDETDEHKRTIAEQLIQKALETRSTCISHQVVQETLNVVTRTAISHERRKRPATSGTDLDALMANHAQPDALPARP